MRKQQRNTITVVLLNINYRGAIDDFSKAIEINPKDSKAYSMRGIAKYKINDKNGACLDWSKAGELGEDNAYNIIRKFCN